MLCFIIIVDYTINWITCHYVTWQLNGWKTVLMNPLVSSVSSKNLENMLIYWHKVFIWNMSGRNWPQNVFLFQLFYPKYCTHEPIREIPYKIPAQIPILTELAQQGCGWKNMSHVCCHSITRMTRLIYMTSVCILFGIRLEI